MTRLVICVVFYPNQALMTLSYFFIICSTGLVSLLDIASASSSNCDKASAASPIQGANPPDRGHKRQFTPPPRSPTQSMTKRLIPMSSAIKKPRPLKQSLTTQPSPARRPLSTFLVEVDLETMLDEIPLSLTTFRGIFKRVETVSSAVDRLLEYAGSDFTEEEEAVIYFRTVISLLVNDRLIENILPLCKEVIARLAVNDGAADEAWARFPEAIDDLRGQSGVLCLSSSRLVREILMPLEKARPVP